jgi:ubiquinone/menaquinone biosynthesis C-methylase UbiE
MGLYNKYVLPKLIVSACRQKPNMRQREKIVPLAKGNVLEIGIGSGLNFPYYDDREVNHLIAIDPSMDVWKKNKFDPKDIPFDFEFIQASAENIPSDNNSFDTIVMTYTLCSIRKTNKAFEEIRRVLKPNGKLVFCEHGKAPDKAIERWQNLINPVWKQFAGGCNLNRDIPLIIEKNGLKINKMETMYHPGWKPGSFNYWGTAKIK